MNRTAVLPCTMRTTADILLTSLNHLAGASTVNWIIPAVSVSPGFGVVNDRPFLLMAVSIFLNDTLSFIVSGIMTSLTVNCRMTAASPPMWSAWGCVAIT